MMVLKVSASSPSASSVSLRTLPIPRRRHSFATPWTDKTIRAFKKVQPLEAPTSSRGLLTAPMHPTRWSTTSPDERGAEPVDQLEAAGRKCGELDDNQRVGSCAIGDATRPRGRCSRFL